jgi:hypothetical protein
MIAHGRENVFFGGWGNLRPGGALPLVRIFAEWTVIIGDWSVPKWVSWVALIVAGGLALLGLRLGQRDE